MQGAVGPTRATISRADPITEVIGGSLPSPAGMRLIGELLRGLPLAVAVREAAPGFPIAAANERFRLWQVSVGAADAAGPGGLAAEISSLVGAAIRTATPQHLRGLRLRAREPDHPPAARAVAWDVAVYPLPDGRGRCGHAVQVVSDASGGMTAAGLSPGSNDHPEDGEEGAAMRLRLERMAALDKLKSDFMNLTTHELRSPLAIVYGYLSMMESGMLGEISVEMREAVSASIRSVELMTQLVTELVEMARLDETRLDASREAVDLSPVVAEAALRVQGSERHQLRLELEEGPTPVLGDRGQLLRVFTNIVDNAIKYSPQGGQIVVRLCRMGTEVVADVTDCGLGIAARDMDRLFTRFGRIVTSATEEIGGTGLGLYLCREMVRRLGGDITADSVEGEGCTFTVRLPLSAPEGRRSSRR